MGVVTEILEWFDETGEELIHRLPQEGSADIEFGAQLIVRESQEAIFYAGGRIRDRLGPGRHTLSARNLPLVAAASNQPGGSGGLLHCAVYFVDRKAFSDIKWGTREALLFCDARLGRIRLRVHGRFSVRLSDPVACIHDLVGSRGRFSTHDLSDQLRGVVVSRLDETLGESLTTVLELPASYDAIGRDLASRLETDFAKYGLELVDLSLSSVTPPEEVQSMVDSQGGLRLVPDLPAHVSNPPTSRRQAPQDAVGNVTLATAESTESAAGFCTACGASLRGGDRFCGRCGHRIGRPVAYVPLSGTE